MLARMKPTLSSLFAAAALSLALSGCYVYDPYYPYGYPAPAGPQAYDRSWNAALGALRDEGVQISREDRTGGLIEGQRGPVGVKARVMTQGDGRVRVEFNTSNTSQDPGLPDRISRAYDARMGR
jgi:hypothetical protein